MKLKSPEKEEEIYRAVLEITADVGLAGLKMANIAKQAGFAHGTVYICQLPTEILPTSNVYPPLALQYKN